MEIISRKYTISTSNNRKVHERQMTTQGPFGVTVSLSCRTVGECVQIYPA